MRREVLDGQEVVETEEYALVRELVDISSNVVWFLRLLERFMPTLSMAALKIAHFSWGSRRALEIVNHQG